MQVIQLGISVPSIFAGTAFGLYNCSEFGAVQGTANSTTAIQTALNTAGSAGGGIVYLGFGTFTHTGLTIPNRVWFMGAGMRATQLFLQASANTNCIVNYVSPNGTAANAQFCKVSDMMIHGNGANQSLGEQDTDNGNTFGRDGIYFTSNPVYVIGENDDYFDTMQSVERVWIYQCKGNGFTGHSRSGMTLKEVMCTENEQWGFVPAYDTELSHCIAGGNFGGGFYIKDRSSVRLTNCKAFYSGHNAGTAAVGDAYGFELVNCSGISLTSCEAQDNYNSGYALVNTAGGNVIQGCVADSNSKAGTGTYPGIDMWNSHYNIIDVICFERNATGTANFQESALRIRNESYSNNIKLKHFATGTAVVGVAITSDSDTNLNKISINNQDGTQYLAASGGTITPKVYDGENVWIYLANNLTVNAPTDGHLGSKLRFHIQQDDGGGNTITWNGVYLLAGGSWSPSTTAYKMNIIEFDYDGEYWFETHRSTNI